jgi:hypothetical protein
MSKFLRLAAVFLCLGVLALGVVAFHFACPRTDPPSPDPNRRSSMPEEVARQEQLDQLQEAIRRRREAKWHVAKEVIVGQRSLMEAIELFRNLNLQWPDLRTGTTMPELVWMSEDELDGRAVIDQVRQVLADLPDEAAAVADRLEKELRELLAERNKRPPAPAEGSR